LSAVATIRFLQQPTRADWVEQAIAHLDTVLVDHAHCERKAAGVALSLISRYPTRPALVKALTAIAREELEHFDQVNRILEQRGVPLVNLVPPPYGAGLNAAVRRAEPGRLLDSLLVAALIEARSHERLGLLAQHLPDPQLAAFYRSLMASEARHYGAYWLLACDDFPRAEVDRRLQELATLESDILATPFPEPRVHA
jgi:tRNA-(ms[2]io[6]A)-hydroxylase